MLERIRQILFTYVCVTTFVLLATAIFMTIFWRDSNVSIALLWQILGVSFICSLGNLVYPTRDLPKKEFLMRFIIQYVYINIIVLGAGLYFEWFLSSNLAMVLGMLLLIAVVFSLIWIIMIYRDKQMAEQMTKRLEELNKE